jgi:hypothetical protein
VDRHPPRTTSDEIDLYIRTYFSLLRSSGEVRVRAFEEAHIYSSSSLHEGCREPAPDVAAFAYSAGRLPSCIFSVRRIVLGQSHEHFEAAGLQVREWQSVSTRGRRRPLRYDGGETLAAFVTSISDIDDLIPIVTAFQIEWNKMHLLLSQSDLGKQLALGEAHAQTSDAAIDLAALATALSLDAGGIKTLKAALGDSLSIGLREMARRELDLSVRLLVGSYSQYQRAAQRWWSGIEPQYLRPTHPRRPPVYFVSSNSHSVVNLLGGYARLHRDQLIQFAHKRNPEQLAEPLAEAIQRGNEAKADNLLYYLLRSFLHDPLGASHRDSVREFDAQSGIQSVESPGRIDVSAQLVQIGSLKQDRVDPRLLPPDVARSFSRLSQSDAVIVNIDYPLGMAAYHLLSRLAQGVGELRGIYVMGKAATLNGRVGDVMISSVVHDEHSLNTYLLRNCFASSDVQPYLEHATVLDNQKALTVRSAFLQNRAYMGSFYHEGYTVLEMEAGPYLSAIYEIVNPSRHPKNEIVHLSNSTPFEVGLLHYASDTPYSRRQSLLSKSLSYFGVESTYGCAIAILSRILRSEIARLSSA